MSMDFFRRGLTEPKPAPKPIGFMRGDKAFGWDSGLEIELPKHRTLVEARGSNFWTWIDRDSGERCWEVASITTPP